MINVAEEKTNMNKIISISLMFLMSWVVFAGGNPEHVAYPTNYKNDFTYYDTRNRMNGKQVAVLYANQIAMNSADSNNLDNGSKIVMEVYKPKLDADGNPIADLNGQFEKDKLAAVAIMEKRIDWNNDFSSNERAGDWGFALYNTNGTPKDNQLDCATCHQPLGNQDYRFSHGSLAEFLNTYK